MRSSDCCAKAEFVRRHQHRLMHHLTRPCGRTRCTSAISSTSCARAIIIVDEFTAAPWWDGAGRWLHQRWRPRKVKVAEENQTVASITSELFQLYSKLSGMTGTAGHGSVRIQQIYA